MRHSHGPVSRDRLRNRLATSSLYEIIVIFFLIVFGIALLNGVAIYVVNAEDNQDVARLIGNYTLEGFIAILGGSVTNSFTTLDYSSISIAVLKASSVLVPALFLGAVVYKVLRPGRNLSTFRHHFNLDLDTSRLETSFYLATRFEVFELLIRSYVKYYKPVLNDGTINPYPLKTVELTSIPSHIPLPFSKIPTRVSVPVVIVSPSNETCSAEEETPTLTCVVEQERLVKAIIDGQSITPGGDESCEILVTIEGKVPQAQIHLLECEKFDLFANVKFGPTPSFTAQFEENRSRYVVRNWDEFDA